MQETLTKSSKQNKDKTKKGRLPDEMMRENRYLAARTVSDVWICYPWEATYDKHTQLLSFNSMKLTKLVTLTNMTNFANLSLHNQHPDTQAIYY